MFWSAVSLLEWKNQEPLHSPKIPIFPFIFRTDTLFGYIKNTFICFWCLETCFLPHTNPKISTINYLPFLFEVMEPDTSLCCQWCSHFINTVVFAVQLFRVSCTFLVSCTEGRMGQLHLKIQLLGILARKMYQPHKQVNCMILLNKAFCCFNKNK